ncbi:Immunity protein 17 [Corynebacterium mustelae]|uniref:Immunity protein 17 n=1 Tax=Corynebacterium mustelae TaxID=571915 RepID=A0A0G3H032_9CORY|nr:hypothetical protein [Corynebacterium mustelae]AKK06761.1 Immunity protein 17 [Corynebacterium mustelae]
MSENFPTSPTNFAQDFGARVRITKSGNHCGDSGKICGISSENETVYGYAVKLDGAERLVMFEPDDLEILEG